MEIGEQIKIERKKAKMTQGELAKLVGLSNNRAVYNIEKGLTTPSFLMLQKLAKVLKAKFIIE